MRRVQSAAVRRVHLAMGMCIFFATLFEDKRPTRARQLVWLETAWRMLDGDREPTFTHWGSLKPPPGTLL